MLRKRNRRREGWGESKRGTGQREHRHAWEQKWEKTKRGGTEGGIAHQTCRGGERNKERGEGKKERQKRRIFQETRKARVKDQNEREKGGD